MRRVKLGALISRVRSQLDVDDGDHTQDSHILERLSSAVAELYSILDDAGERFREKRFWFTGADLTAATADNADEKGAFLQLPKNFDSMIGVDSMQSNWYALEQLMIQERNDYGWIFANYASGWWLQNDRLYLMPAPTDARKFRMIYTELAPVFSADAPDDQEVDIYVARGDEFLVWYVVAQLKDRSDEDYRFAVGQLQEQRENVQHRAAKRVLRNYNTPQVYDEYEGRRRRWEGSYD